MQAAARPISKTDPGPARAAGAILVDAEQRSERVLAWLRLVALVVLVLVERIFDLNSHVFVFSLGAYGAATLLALALARGRTHRPWLGWVLTTLDTALVLHFAATLVFIGGWSTSDAMVAPGVLMIFLVLVQGAVRYRPELVLHAAGLFLGGWVLLHFAADPIAEDHLRHWRGDEAALAAVVALTALALVAAAGRARRLLTAAIAESRLRAALSRFVPAKLVEELSRDHGAAEHLTGRTHRVAVLFIDIRGFTTIVEDLRPEEVLELLNEYRRRVTRPVLDHGGAIDKFIGDAVMVVFGVPHGRPTDPADALRCSLAVLNSISEWNVERARHDRDRSALRRGDCRCRRKWRAARVHGPRRHCESCSACRTARCTQQGAASRDARSPGRGATGRSCNRRSEGVDRSEARHRQGTPEACRLLALSFGPFSATGTYPSGCARRFRAAMLQPITPAAIEFSE